MMRSRTGLRLVNASLHARRRGASLRALGLTLAGLSAGTAIVLVTWSALQSKSQPAPPGELPAQIAPSSEQPAPETARPPDFENIQDLVIGSDKGHIELVDEQNNVVRELFYDQFTPQESGRFFVTQPRAWIYFDDGQTVLVEAASLRYLQPAGAQEPESGRFDGGVQMSIFAPIESGAGLRARDYDEENENRPSPDVTVLLDALNFDSGIGEFSTTDRVQVLAAGITAGFDGLTMVVDEQRQRLAYFKTDGNGVLAVRPDELRSASDSDGSGGDQGTSQVDESVAAVGVEQSYRAEFAGDVRVLSGDLELQADMLEAWAALIDGALPRDAIAPFSRSTSEDRDSVATDGARNSDASPTRTEEIILSWAGPLTVRPLDDRPVELANDALAARFTATESGAVTFDDEIAGLSMRCSAVEYGLTSRSLLLDGAGPRGVAIRSVNQAELLTSRLELDLTTGRGAIPGPGVVRTTPTDDSQEQSISWQSRSDITLATNGNHVDFGRKWPLREAIFTGEAVGAADGATVQGEFIRAIFREESVDTADLSRVIVEGDARADAGNDGRMTARRIDVEFAQSSELTQPSPRLVTAEGNVRASRGRASLEAELLEARIVEDVDGLAISTMRADLDVRITTPDGETVSADDLRADMAAGIYDLAGENVVLTSGRTSLEGKSMRIEETAERLTVFGAGALQYERSSGQEGPYESAYITWVDGLVYNGLDGLAEFTGDCEALAQVDALGRDHATAERVLVSLVTQQTGAGEGSDGLTGRVGRSVRSVRLFGASLDGAGDGEAEFESRRYTPDEQAPDEVKLESLVFLASDEIDADVESDTLSTPGPGRLLLEDRRPERGDGDEPSNGGLSSRGTSLFEWSGDMRLRRSIGDAQMRRAVRLRHLPPGSDTAAELESEQVLATIDLPSNEDGVARLLSAEATGGVYLRRGTRQLITDRLLYDATMGVAEAIAAPGNAVTIFDSMQPTPLTGSLLRWDLTRDRLEWRDAGETSAPR